MQSIFDLVTAEEIKSYWETIQADVEALLGDELFPSQQKLGLDLKWLKGKEGLPIVLKPSAYDVAAIKRDRIGFDKITAEMPFFKESLMIDEELRQQLNMVLETGNQTYIDAVMSRIFADDMQLLKGARAQRERMKMSLITTGAISIAANGQAYDYDYGIGDDQKPTVSVSWSDPDADIIGDIRTYQEDREEKTGVKPTRAVCSRKTFGYILKNKAIRNAIWGNNSAAPISETRALQYIQTELGLTIAIYTKKYVNEAGNTMAYIPDDVFTLLPPGQLGTGWFGTTPEQSDLMTGTAANVSITDTGVAITTSKKVDPVNVDTKVSMIFLPSFEAADQIVIMDVVTA